MDPFHSPNSRDFETTHWSLVSIAQSDESDSVNARHALEVLCGTYWYPVYSFVRHKGYSATDAQDLTQSFLVQFIETLGFASADRQRGRFRTYLLGALKHYLANEWHRGRAKKRGGGMTLLEWDALDAEARYALEPVEQGDPDHLYDREWALELIERTKRLLEEEAIATGKLDLYEGLKGSLSGEEPPRDETAAHLGISVGAVKAAVHRMRQRFRSLLRSEISDTVNTSSEIDDEMRHLVAVLRKK